MESRLLYDRREAARLLSVSVRTLDRLIGTKKDYRTARWALRANPACRIDEAIPA